MKRISKQTRLRLYRLAKKLKRELKKELIKIRQRKTRPLRKRKEKKLISIVPKVSINATKAPTNISKVETIVAPSEFDIVSSENRSVLMDFLDHLRKSFSCNHIIQIDIDFTNTEKFDANATLLFYAELQYLIQMRQSGLTVTYKAPINEKASAVLHQIGVHKICGGQDDINHAHNYEDVVHWRVAQGTLVDNSLCAPAIEKYEGQLAEPLINGLFRVLAEAMTNTIHHAYIDTREDKLNYKPPKKNWWMFSQAKDNHLTVVFCDLGIGIPRTLPIKKPSLYRKLITFRKTHQDSEYIKIAVKYGTTRMGKAERGKGLGDMVNTITNLKSGTVQIISNRGFYFKDETRVKTGNLTKSILGTLIYWRVPLTNEL